MSNDHPPVIPIFVLGSGRSGTTWLCNELSCHPQIAGPHHLVHWGADESVILRSKLWAGDLSDHHQFIRFHETYSSSDYFRLARGNKDFYYRERERFDHFFDYFLELMDQFACQEGVRFWATKLDPFFFYYPQELKTFLERLESRYEEVRWVAISRGFPRVIRSVLNNEGESSTHQRPRLLRDLSALVYTARHVIEERGRQKLIESRGGFSLRFEDLKQHKAGTLDGLGAYLGLHFSEDGYSQYVPNSSYADPNRKRRDSQLTIFLATKVWRPAFSLLPILGWLLIVLREWLRGTPCPFNWRLLSLEQMPERFAKHLLDTGQTGLYREIFEASDQEPTPRYPSRIRIQPKEGRIEASSLTRRIPRSSRQK